MKFIRTEEWNSIVRGKAGTLLDVEIKVAIKGNYKMQ